MNWNKAIVFAALALGALGVSGCNFANDNSTSSSDARVLVEEKIDEVIETNPNITRNSLYCFTSDGTPKCSYSIKERKEVRVGEYTQSTITGECSLNKIGQVSCTNDEWMSAPVPEKLTYNGDLSVNCPSLVYCTPSDPARK